MTVKNNLRVNQRLWFDEREYRSDDRYKCLSESNQFLVDQMHRDGFVIINNSVEDSIIDRTLEFEKEWIAANRDHYEKNRKPDGNPPRIVDFHRESSRVSELFTNNIALEIQDILFDARASIYTSLFFATSTQQPFHRDVPVFRTSPENFYFGMWVALEDANLENGTLRVYRGGHKIRVDQYRIPNKYGFDAFDVPQLQNDLWNEYQKQVDEECRRSGLEVLTIQAKKGDTILWHPLLPHSGGKIVVPGLTRYSIVFHTVPEGVPVYRSDVFFNPKARFVTTKSRFNYIRLDGGRLAADFGPCKLRNR